MLFKTTAILAAALVPLLPAQAQDTPTPQAPSETAALEAAVVEHRLDNGWTFLLLPREGAPVASFHTYIDVGGIFEDDGATGMAHMFEHMAFKGSDRIGTTDWEAESKLLDEVERAYQAYEAAKGVAEPGELAALRSSFEEAQAAAAVPIASEEFTRLLEEAGGATTLNASTSAEETRYMVSLPSNRIELWCWLERERFHRPVLREFYKEREAVKEERRMRVDSSPFGALLESLYATAFTTHPYRRPVIGYADDLDHFTRTEAEAFYAKHYGVRRFVTSIVGDIDPKTLVPMLERYFGDLPAGPEPTTVDVVEPEQTEQRRVEVEFPAMPVLMMAWHIPALSAPDYPALEIGLYTFATAQTSRLQTSLVRTSGIAAQVGAATGLPGDRHPNLALVFGVPSNGASLGDLESAIDAELESFLASGPTEAELEAARTVSRAGLLRSLRDDSELAAQLCEWQSKSGDWRNLFRRTAEYRDITAEQVRSAMQRYLQPTGRTVATLVPPAPQPDAQPTEEQ
ncbi:MAG: pitrilysin family protein [Planctomycetota bacterium]|nr:pitrilysin family protein [Planctomycetota bacterium]